MATWGVVTEQFNGASSKLAINTGAYATGNSGAAAAGGLTVGDFGGAGGAPGNSLIGRIIVVNRILTDPEIAQARTWVGAGVGVPL